MIVMRRSVFVNHAAEESCPADGGVAADGDCLGWGSRRSLSQGTVWAMAVDLQYGFQMVPGEDQHSVGALAADTADPAFGVGVCSWALRWCPQYGDAGRCGDGVEGLGELGVAVADEEAETLGAIVQIHQQISGVLRSPTRPSGSGRAQHVYSPAGDLDREEHVDPLEEDGIDGEKSQARTPEAWARRNVLQDASVRRGAGSTSARRRIRHTVAADTRYPSPINSPWMRRWPQLRFSPASCSTSRRISCSTGGRPGALRG
jgi:hypothetical protein